MWGNTNVFQFYIMSMMLKALSFTSLAALTALVLLVVAEDFVGERSSPLLQLPEPAYLSMVIKPVTGVAFAVPMCQASATKDFKGSSSENPYTDDHNVFTDEPPGIRTINSDGDKTFYDRLDQRWETYTVMQSHESEPLTGSTPNNSEDKDTPATPGTPATPPGGGQPTEGGEEVKEGEEGGEGIVFPTARLEVRNISRTPPTEWTGNNITIAPNDQIHLRWSSQNAVSCEAVHFTTGGATSGTDTDVVEPALDRTREYALFCSNSRAGAWDILQVSVSVTAPQLFTSHRIIRADDTATLTWDLNGNDPASCTLKGPALDRTTLAGVTQEQVQITGQSVFTLDCPGGSDQVRIRTTGQVFER